MTASKTYPFPPLTLDRPALYQIEIQGLLDESWSANFEGMTISSKTIGKHRKITTLRGVVVDQATLHGILNSIRDLGLPLLKVEYLSPTEKKTKGD
jgi:hypothetical protein